MKPPQHRIDAEPVYIRREDPAWDLEKIGEELEKLDGDARSEHPYVAFYAGGSRYDLGAMHDGHTPSEYLLDDVEPVKFHLRRLGATKLAEVQDMLVREQARPTEERSYLAVWVKACKQGLRDVTGPNAPELKFTNRGELSEGSIDEIHDAFGGLGALQQIGSAIWQVSQPLTEAEKKR